MSYNGITTGLNSYMRGTDRLTSFSGSKYKGYVSFGDRTAQELAKANGTAGSDMVDYASLIGDQEMTTDEFKEKISDFISSMERHASRSKDAIAIHLTDDAFETMMSDKDYTNWVLNTIADSLGTEDPKSEALGGAFDIKYFGAAVANYASDFWYGGTDSSNDLFNWNLFNNKASGSFWQSVNSNAKANLLLSQAQTKQQQMLAQQTASQYQALQALKGMQTGPSIK